MNANTVSNDCEVCQAEPIFGVASSSIAPVSLAFGKRCLQNRAEPIWALEAMMQVKTESRLKILLRDDVIDKQILDRVKVYVNDKYVTVREWSQSHE